MVENVTETTNVDVRKVSWAITVKWKMDINIQLANVKNHADMEASVCQITNANVIKDGPVAFATNVVIKNGTKIMLSTERFGFSTSQEIATATATTTDAFEAYSRPKCHTKWKSK